MTLLWPYYLIDQSYVSLLRCCALRLGQPDADLLEKSLSADSTSITLESLQPGTEYVISLYPLFPRNSASPSVLNANTCTCNISAEFYIDGHIWLWWFCDVVSCLSGSQGGAAVICRECGVRGQHPCAMERRQWGPGLSSCLGAIHRSYIKHQSIQYTVHM